MNIEDLQKNITKEQRDENINALLEGRKIEEISYEIEISNGGKLKINKDGLSILTEPKSYVEYINMTASITGSNMFE